MSSPAGSPNANTAGCCETAKFWCCRFFEMFHLYLSDHRSIDRCHHTVIVIQAMRWSCSLIFGITLGDPSINGWRNCWKRILNYGFPHWIFTLVCPFHIFFSNFEFGAASLQKPIQKPFWFVYNFSYHGNYIKRQKHI